MTTAAIAVEAAGLVHHALSGTRGYFTWPSQAVPIGTAVAAYCLIKVLSAEVIAPLVARRPIEPAWPSRMVMVAPIYFIGAALAVGLVVVISNRMWELLPAALVPVYFGAQAYSAYMGTSKTTPPPRVIGRSVRGSPSSTLPLHHALGDAAERILVARANRVLGRALTAVLPALAKHRAARTIAEAMTDRHPRTLQQLPLPLAHRRKSCNENRPVFDG